MIKKIFPFLMTVVLILGLTGSARATLTDMGDGTIYDTDRQLTWLKDVGIGGMVGVTWSNAKTWADNLIYAGFSDWRLPATLQPDHSCGSQSSDKYWGWNCTGSEMGHLYYTELGNLAGGPMSNTGPFSNLQSDTYWSGTEGGPDPTGAWGFGFYSGRQGTYNMDNTLLSWAVRSGNRSASVPEPGTLMLLGSGLAGIVVWRKRLG